MNKVISLSITDLLTRFSNQIPKLITSKVEKCIILSELDLQFSILYYLEDIFLKNNDKRWRIHNCYYLELIKKYPDLMIFLDNKPIFCIELKYYAFEIPKKNLILKDLKKLKLYFKMFPTLKHGYSLNIYSIETSKHKSFDRTCKNKIKDDRIFLINLNLVDLISNFEEIKNKYENYIENLKKVIFRRSRLLNF